MRFKAFIPMIISFLHKSFYDTVSLPRSLVCVLQKFVRCCEAGGEFIDQHAPTTSSAH